MHAHKATERLRSIDSEIDRLEHQLRYGQCSSVERFQSHNALGMEIYYNDNIATDLKKIDYLPAFDLINFDDVVKRAEAVARENAFHVIKHLMMFSPSDGEPLKLATAESLTGGMIFSTLVDVPCGGKHKYGAFGVYDTEAKRTFLGVDAPDVYTHLCAHQMAVGVLRNSNASIAIAVTGNAMPLQGTKCNMDELKQLGEVFIGIAGYNTDGNIIVSTKVYNFCDEKFKGNGFAEAWYKTVVAETSLSRHVEKLKDEETGVFNTFGELVDGYNPYVCTSLLSRFIRVQTTIQAFRDVCMFMKKHRPRVPYHLVRTEAATKILKDLREEFKGNNAILNVRRMDSIRRKNPDGSAITDVQALNVGPNAPDTPRSDIHNGSFCLDKFNQNLPSLAP
jgi:nicotinamide mononucleotide (NMN) deamidase PncC